MGEAFGVMFTGVIVVFLALLILIAAVWVMGKIFSGLSSGGKKQQEEKEAKEPARENTVAEKPAAVPEVEAGISDEVVAAITAALACVMGKAKGGKPFAIRSIKRAKGSQNAWNAAGLVESTRPF